MNKFIILLMVLAIQLPCVNLYSQQTLSSQEMIAISPLVCDNLKLPADAKSSLQTRMMQMVTSNGFGASSTRYAIVPNVTIIDKQITGTVPAQYIVELEVSLYVYDAVEDFVVDETSFVVKGVGRLENKAAIQAVNQIKGSSPQVKGFMKSCRSKIINYYNTRIPALISKAESLSERQQYQEAISVLASIPETVDQYQVVSEFMTVVYKKKIDHDATAAIQAANGKMALRDYDGALEALSLVDPASAKSKEASQIIAQIKDKVDIKELAELESKMKADEKSLADRKLSSEREHELRKLEIKASKDIAAAYNKSDSQTDAFTKKVNKWFMNKFN